VVSQKQIWTLPMTHEASQDAVPAYLSRFGCPQLAQDKQSSLSSFPGPFSWYAHSYFPSGKGLLILHFSRPLPPLLGASMAFLLLIRASPIPSTYSHWSLFTAQQWVISHSFSTLEGYYLLYLPLYPPNLGSSIGKHSTVCWKNDFGDLQVSFCDLMSLKQQVVKYVHGSNHCIVRKNTNFIL
jgi:hypothetical protein